MSDTIICPHCNGEGEGIVSHVRYASGGGASNMLLPCTTCQGSGRVDARTTQWQAVGDTCRQKRLANYVNMHALGLKFGLSTVQVSQMENGRVDPTPLAEAWKKEEGKPP